MPIVVSPRVVAPFQIEQFTSPSTTFDGCDDPALRVEVYCGQQPRFFVAVESAAWSNWACVIASIRYISGDAPAVSANPGDRPPTRGGAIECEVRLAVAVVVGGNRDITGIPHRTTGPPA